MPPPLTYANYLDFEKLLTLQNPRSSPADTTKCCSSSFIKPRSSGSSSCCMSSKRSNATFLRRFVRRDPFLERHAHDHEDACWSNDILETMTPSLFSSFRDRLETASGFQSVQFREIELLLGYKRKVTLAHVEPGFPGADQLQPGSQNAP